MDTIMEYTKISPLGQRKGIGTYDTFYDLSLYKSIQEAIDKNDVIIVDFVKDSDNIIYFEIYKSSDTENKQYHCLNFQHFPCGVDTLDDYLLTAIIEEKYYQHRFFIK